MTRPTRFVPTARAIAARGQRLPVQSGAFASALLLTAGLATPAMAATQFAATIVPEQIVGSTPTASGSGTATATLTGGPGTWVFSYVADFYGYDFGAYMVPFVTTGTSPADGQPSATATTASLLDDVRNFHIHTGARGATGPVAYSVRAPDRENGVEPNVQIQLLGPTHARITGTWDLADGQVGGTNAQTQAGNLGFWAPIMLAAQPGTEIGLYFDIHTNAFPGSEIRGQIVAVPEPGTWALMLGGLGLVAFTARRSRSA
jgi:hypothetical protein